MEEQKKIVDEQTGKIYDLVPEQTWDIIAATFSILYLVAMLVIFSVLLFAVLANQSSHEDNPIYVLMAYSAIGGGLGGTINGIRSLIKWHAERKAFMRRYVWKHISQPLLGFALAILVYALFRSGFVAFGGNFMPNENFHNQALAALAVGALSGYGSRRVLIWLNGLVKKLFKTTETVEAKESDLKDNTGK